MKLRHSLALGLLVPFAALGAAEVGRLLVGSVPVVEADHAPSDRDCGGCWDDADDDGSDTDVGCIDDCIAPADEE